MTELTEEPAPLDFSAHYTVRGRPGVAWRLIRYETEWTEESWELSCENPAHVYDYDPDEPDPDDDTHDAACYLYNEPEEIDNTRMVRAVMVGDDRVEVIDAGDLEILPDTGFCRECGQVGCTSDVYE
jgi:hypothetical protein